MRIIDSHDNRKLTATTTAAIATPLRWRHQHTQTRPRRAGEGDSLLIGNEGRYVCAAAQQGRSAQIVGYKIEDDHPNLTDGQVDTFHRCCNGYPLP